MMSNPAEKTLIHTAHGLKKCPSCNTWFFHERDRQAHVQTHWRPTRNGEGEWMPSENDTYLTQLIRNVGTLVQDGYRYMLIHGEQTIYRKKA